MSWFGLGKEVESAGNGVSNVIESVRFALTGDLPPEERIKMQELLVKLQALESKILDGQVQMNLKEAESTNLFKSGWRPAIGWIGVISLFYHFIGYNLLSWYIVIAKLDITAPALNTEGLFPLVLGMLGIGGYRTYEKHKGITK